LGATATGIGVKMFGKISEIDGKAISRIFVYIVSIIIVVFVILLFIHFFIKPIFILHPGSPGIIPIPGFDDGTLYWDKTTAAKIENKDLTISQLYSNYSLTLDIFIQNPFQFSDNHRVLFSRGAEYKTGILSDATIMGVLSTYNLAVALSPDTNDLIVSVLNINGRGEDIEIKNIPVQQPFKLGIVILDTAMEVYINGRLVKTKIYSDKLKDIVGDILPAQNTEATIAKLRNLKIWPRILTASEIRYSKPDLSSAEDFAASAIPNASTCSSNINTEDSNESTSKWLNSFSAKMHV